MSKTASLDAPKGYSPLDILMSMAGGMSGSPGVDSLFSSMVADTPTQADPTGISATADPTTNTTPSINANRANVLAKDISDLKRCLSAIRKTPKDTILDNAAQPSKKQKTSTADTEPETTASDEASTTPQAETLDAEVSATPVESTDETAISDADDDGDQTLTDIIAEILMIAQQIIQTLQQQQSTQGGVSAETTQTAQEALTAKDLTLSGLNENGLAFNGTPKGLLVELMKMIEKSAQKVLDDLAAEGASTAEGTANAAVTAIVSDAVAQLKDLANGLQTILDDVRRKSPVFSAPPAAETDETVPTKTIEEPAQTVSVVADTATAETTSAENASTNTSGTNDEPPAPATDDAPTSDADDAEALAIALSLAPPHKKAPAAEQAAAQASTDVAKNAKGGIAAGATQAAAAQIASKSQQEAPIPPQVSTAQTESDIEEPVNTGKSEKTSLPESLTIDTSASQQTGIDLNAGSLLNNGSSSFSFDDANNPASWTPSEKGQVSGTYNFASTLSAFRAANGGTTGLPSAVDQVILQMNRNVKNGQSQMSLQLQPGDLGKITVKLEFSEGDKVQGTVVADNPKTLEMLQKDSRSLERALQDAGLRADPGSLQFSLGGQQNGRDAGQAAGNGKSGNAQFGTISAGDSAESEGLAALSESYYITPNGVNIQV